MTGTLDELLRDTISPEADAIGDWDGVVATVRRRHRRRAIAFRASALSFLVLAGLAVFLSATGSGIDTIPEPSGLGQPQDSAATRWPSAQTIFDSTAPRPAAHLWLGWLVGLVLPAFAGLGAWLAAPRHLRIETASQRFTRAYLGALVSFATGLILVGVLWVLNFFAYNPLEVITNQSLLFSLFAGALNGLPWFAGVAGFSLAMTKSGFYSESPALSRLGVMDRAGGVFQLFLAVLGAFYLGLLFTGFEGLLRWSTWAQSVGVEATGRGMWRPMIPGSGAFLNSDGRDISMSGSLIALLVAALWARLMWRYCRRSIDMALAGERFSFDLGRMRDITFGQYFGGALVLAGLLLPLVNFGAVLTQTDRLATSTAPPPTMGEVSSDQNRVRSPIGGGPLFEVNYWTRGGPSELEASFNDPPLATDLVLPGDWNSQSCAGDDLGPCLLYPADDVSGDRWLADQTLGSANLRLVGRPSNGSDSRDVFPFALFGGVALLLLGAAMHSGRAVRYVIGPVATAASLLMVRASLDGFSRTALIFTRYEAVSGERAGTLTADQLVTDPIFEEVHNVWPVWHYPFAVTSLAMWLAVAVLGIRLIRPDRRWTVVTSILAAALTAWIAWKYGDITWQANYIVD